MIEFGIVRENLWDVYLSLPTLEKDVIHLCAVIHEPTTAPIIYNCFRKSRMADRHLHISSLKTIDPIFQNLYTSNLLTDRFQCHPAFTEIAIRQAAACRDEYYFQDMILAVQDVLPFSDSYRYPAGSTEHHDRLMRDFRIGIYTLNPAHIRECHRQLISDYAMDSGFVNPFVRVFLNPFDRNWLVCLPVDVQISALTAIFSHTVSHLNSDSDSDALSYGISQKFIEQVPESDRADYLSHLIPRLLMGGRIAPARHLLSEAETSPLLSGFSGWIYLLEGRTKTAVQSFENDLNLLQKRTRNKTEYFKGLAGIFFILAILKLAGRDLFETVDATLKSARSNRFQGNVLGSLYALLNAVVHILKFETEAAADILSGIPIGSHPLTSYFAALVEYGISRTLTPDSRKRISDLFSRAKTAEIHWLTLECLELLRATAPPNADLTDADLTDADLTDDIRRIQANQGIHSLFTIIAPEAPWKPRLHALAYSLNSPSRHSTKVGALRLAWIIRLKDHHIELIPREQKLGASGTWYPGKAIPLKHLFGNPQRDYMTRQDQILSSSIRKVKFNARIFQYFFDWDKALPALVGHPLVFLADQPDYPIEIVKGAPKVLVETQDSVIQLTFSPKMVENHIAVTRETPNRLSIVCLGAEQQRIARIIGDTGIAVPVSARKEVLDAIAGLSSIITVHSDISAAACIETDADPLPHIHLTTCASGFRVEFFIKPVRGGEIKLKPGEGAERIIGDIDGLPCQIRRDLAGELKKTADAVAGCPALSRFPHVNWQWLITDPYDFLDILLELNLLQQQGHIIVEWPEGEKLRITRETMFSDLRVKIKSRLNCFEMSGQLVVDDALMLELRDLIAMIPQIHKRFVPLGEGQFLALTEDLKNQLKAIAAITELRNRSLRFQPAAAPTIDSLTQHLTHIETDENWENHLRRIKSGSMHVPEIPKDLKATLRNYQIDGYTWLSRLSFWGVGACLADDMGLGKTVQVLAVILERALNGPSLVIAPASVCLNWLDEIQRFAPTLNAVRLEDRLREKTIQELKPFDVLVVSYGLLMHEADLLSSIIWETVVLDEAQVIKNMKAKRSQAAMNLNGKFRIITTGTPVENHIGELFTLFHFINPGLLGSARHFFTTFTDPIEKLQDTEALDRLKKIIQPFILRRMKSEVLSELPDLTEIVLHVDFYPGETAFYESLRINALKLIETSRTETGSQYQFRLFGEIVKLRQTCCHSRLVQPASQLACAKLDLFERLVSELLENGHKVLVFSQFVGYLSLIRESLDHQGIPYRYLDGTTPLRDRKREIDAFQAGNGDVFLISLKAGGMGLNLTAADYVIHMDPWWNPAVESQASSRAHRIGQERPVTVYRLVVRNTIEEKIVALHRHKQNLAGALLEGGDISGRITAQELLEMIQQEKTVDR